MPELPSGTLWLLESWPWPPFTHALLCMHGYRHSASECHAWSKRLPIYNVGGVACQDIATLATFNQGLGEINDAAIYIKGNEIDWVGRTADLPPDKTSADTILSLPDQVVIPGLVNTHHHMFQCITRCVAQASSLSTV